MMKQFKTAKPPPTSQLAHQQYLKGVPFTNAKSRTENRNKNHPVGGEFENSTILSVHPVLFEVTGGTNAALFLRQLLKQLQSVDPTSVILARAEAPEDARPLSDVSELPSDAIEEYVKYYLDGLTVRNVTMKGKFLVQCSVKFTAFKWSTGFLAWLKGVKKDDFKIQLDNCVLEGATRSVVGFFYNVCPRPDMEVIFRDNIVKALCEDSEQEPGQEIPPFAIQVRPLYVKQRQARTYRVVAQDEQGAKKLSEMLLTLIGGPSADVMFIPIDVFTSLSMNKKVEFFDMQAYFDAKHKAWSFRGIADSDRLLPVEGQMKSVQEWIAMQTTAAGQPLFSKVFPSIDGEMVFWFDKDNSKEVHAWIKTALCEIATMTGYDLPDDWERACYMFTDPQKIWYERSLLTTDTTLPVQRQMFEGYVFPSQAHVTTTTNQIYGKSQNKKQGKSPRLSLVFDLDEVDSVLSNESKSQASGGKSKTSRRSRRTNKKNKAVVENTTTATPVPPLAQKKGLQVNQPATATSTTSSPTRKTQDATTLKQSSKQQTVKTNDIKQANDKQMANDKKQQDKLKKEAAAQMQEANKKEIARKASMKSIASAEDAYAKLKGSLTGNSSCFASRFVLTYDEYGNKFASVYVEGQLVPVTERTLLANWKEKGIGPDQDKKRITKNLEYHNGRFVQYEVEDDDEDDDHNDDDDNDEEEVIGDEDDQDDQEDQNGMNISNDDLGSIQGDDATVESKNTAVSQRSSYSDAARRAIDTRTTMVKPSLQLLQAQKNTRAARGLGITTGRTTTTLRSGRGGGLDDKRGQHSRSAVTQKPRSDVARIFSMLDQTSKPSTSPMGKTVLPKIDHKVKAIAMDIEQRQMTTASSSAQQQARAISSTTGSTTQNQEQNVTKSTMAKKGHQQDSPHSQESYEQEDRKPAAKTAIAEETVKAAVQTSTLELPPRTTAEAFVRRMRSMKNEHKDQLLTLEKERNEERTERETERQEWLRQQIDMQQKLAQLEQQMERLFEQTHPEINNSQAMATFSTPPTVDMADRTRNTSQHSSESQIWQVATRHQNHYHSPPSRNMTRTEAKTKKTRVSTSPATSQLTIESNRYNALAEIEEDPHTQDNSESENPTSAATAEGQTKQHAEHQETRNPTSTGSAGASDTQSQDNGETDSVEPEPDASDTQSQDNGEIYSVEPESDANDTQSQDNGETDSVEPEPVDSTKQILFGGYRTRNPPNCPGSADSGKSL